MILALAVSTPREAEQKFFAAARGGLLFFKKELLTFVSNKEVRECRRFYVSVSA
jgi:hypothetical protein